MRTSKPEFLYDKDDYPLEIIRTYTEVNDRGNGTKKFDLFCPRCYHLWKGVTKGNVVKRSCAICKQCEREVKALEKLNDKIKKLDPDSQIVACGRKNTQYFKFHCLNCDQYFYQKWQGKYKLNCTHCSQTAKLNLFQAYQKLTKKWKYYIIANPSEYTSTSKKMWVKCTKCGTPVFASINNLSNGTCHYCAGSLKKTFKERAFEVKKESRDLVQLLKLKDGIGSFVCSEGHHFDAKMNTFLQGNSNCPVCFSSIGEREIYAYLTSHRIKFVRQKRFTTCRDKYPLPFDFYIDDKLLVEFDGIQHFKKVDLFNNTDPFEDRVRRDRIKDGWARDNNIPLLRIRYDEIKEVDNILENKLNELDIVPDGNAYVGKGKTFPDSSAYDYVKNEFQRKGVTLKEIAEEAYEGQKRFNPRLKVDEFERAIETIMHKREVLNACMVGLNMDKLATQNVVDEPLQQVIQEDNHAFGIDEELAISICGLYGSVAITQYGYLDLSKTGLAARLDNNENGEVNTFIDDLISALVACTEAKVMHHNAGLPFDD